MSHIKEQRPPRQVFQKTYAGEKGPARRTRTDDIRQMDTSPVQVARKDLSEFARVSFLSNFLVIPPSSDGVGNSL